MLGVQYPLKKWIIDIDCYLRWSEKWNEKKKEMFVNIIGTQMGAA